MWVIIENEEEKFLGRGRYLNPGKRRGMVMKAEMGYYYAHSCVGHWETFKQTMARRFAVRRTSSHKRIFQENRKQLKSLRFGGKLLLSKRLFSTLHGLENLTTFNIAYHPRYITYSYFVEGLAECLPHFKKLKEFVNMEV